MSLLEKSKKIKILDGGLACDLFINGNVDKESLNNDPLWIGRVLFENPDEIKMAHRRFIRAGCDVITTGSYQCSVAGFLKHTPLSEEKAKQLIGSTVDIAKEAILEEKCGREIEIAASISPYGATLHDFSEYNGSYIDGLSEKDLMEFHFPNVITFLKKDVKLFAVETCPALKEARAILKLIECSPEVKAWVSFTTTDGHATAYGDDFRQVFSELSQNKQVIAVGVNCCLTEHVLKAACEAEGRLGDHQSFIAYPNKFVSNEKGYASKGSVPWRPYVKSWLETGIFGYVGGCCMVEPKDISTLKREVRRWKPPKHPNH